MDADTKVAAQQPFAKLNVISSKNGKKKKSKRHHHKSRHSKQERSSSSDSSVRSRRRSKSKKEHKSRNSSKKTHKDKAKLTSAHVKKLHRSRSTSHSSPSSRSSSSRRSHSRNSSSDYREESHDHHLNASAYLAKPGFNTGTAFRYSAPSKFFHRGGRSNPTDNAAYLKRITTMLQNINNAMAPNGKHASNLKYQNESNPNNRFFQQFQDNYRRLKAGEKVSKLYQASFPVQHIPREMSNFRLLGRNIFTASDDEDASTPSAKHSKEKSRHRSSSDSSRASGDERNAKSKSSSTLKKTYQKQKPTSMIPTKLTTFLADIMQNSSPEIVASTLANAASGNNNKRDRSKTMVDKKVEEFKNYARFQQTQIAANTKASIADPQEIEKKIHGLAKRLKMKTVGLHDDYAAQGIRRSDSSSDSDSDASEPRRDKVADIVAAGLSSHTKVTSTDQVIGPSSAEHQTDGNDSDGSMLNMNEDLKPIHYYIKDRERMLSEMFRCIRGHKLQAILPDILKTRSLDEIKARCLDQLDILSKKRIRSILLAQTMTSSSGTEDSTDEDEQRASSLLPQSNRSAVATTIDVAMSPRVNRSESLPNNKFRPVEMQPIAESSSLFTTASSHISKAAIVGVQEDVNDYYEDFKKMKKLTNIRRNEQDDESSSFADQSVVKPLQPIGTNLPKFEFKPTANLSLTHSQRAHFNAHRTVNRQQKENEVRQEIDDLLFTDDFILPAGERPRSSAELSCTEQCHNGLPPKIQYKISSGPPKKGSLGDLLKQKRSQVNERSPSPVISPPLRRRYRSSSLSSSSSERLSRCESAENNARVSDTDVDMSDLSKLLDLNEEDELLLLQIEVEQEKREIRRRQKRKRKEEKKKAKAEKRVIGKCIYDLIQEVVVQANTKTCSKRPLDINNCDDRSKRSKTVDRILKS